MRQSPFNDVPLTAERGAVFVITLVVLLVLLAFAAYAVDEGIWFVHHEHLQTQADAAALAAAQDFQFPCTTATESEIATVVHQYDGTTVSSGGYNEQVPVLPEPSETYSEAKHNLISQINEPDYIHQSQPNNPGLTGHPCADSAINVKLSETNLPSFFPPLISPKYITAQAQVSIEALTSSKGAQLPLAVEQSTPKTVHVELVDESTGKVLGCPEPTATPCSTTLQTSDNQTWTTVKPLPVEFTNAAAGNPSFPVGLRVALSSSADTKCGDAGVSCYDSSSTKGIVFIRAWSAQTSGSTPPPQAREATIVPTASGGCSNGWFISSAASCTVQLQANVQFASGIKCTEASLTLVVAGQTPTMTCPTGATASGVWTSSPVTISPASNSVPFTLEWAQTTGTVEGNTCSTAKKNPCKGSFGEVQRVFSGAFDLPSASESHSGPIVVAGVTDAGSGNEVSSVQRCSTGVASCSESVNVTIGVEGIQNSETIGSSPVVLRAGGSQGNGAIACRGNGTPMFTEAIFLGCPGPFATTSAPASEACAGNPNPAVCVTTDPGNGKKIDPGIDCRIDGSTKANSCSAVATCTDPNRWTSPNTISEILSQSPPDRRLLDVFITDTHLGSGTEAVPIRAFATFYITGWDGKGGEDPCTKAGISNGLTFAPDDTPGENEIEGHFVKFVDLSSSGGGSGQCTPISTLGDCIAILTK